MKKSVMTFLVLLLLFNTGFSQNRNLNPDPNGPEWIVGGLRELTEKDWEYLNSLPELSFKDGQNGFSKIELPQNVDNSQSTHFRPIFNQADGSCGQASGIGYTFTYEMCLKRDLPAHVSANQFPTHYTYNFLNGGTGSNGSWYFDGWMISKENGIPNATTYGGSINPLGANGWMTGYDNYLAGMENRVQSVFSINVSTAEGLETLKQWLYDRGNGSEEGGLVCFAAGAVYPDAVLPVGTAEAGMDLITHWGTEVNHAMTFAGYNDSIRYDFNNDGQYTNNIDITGDGIIDLRDWEIGGLIVVNSWGTYWGNSGRSYMMYRLLAEEVANGGIWANLVQGIEVKETYDPLLSLKATIEHDSRNKLKISAGVSLNLEATEPEFIIDFPLFNYQGGSYYMQGGTSNEANKTLELGLDITPLLSYIENGVAAKFFLQVDEDDTFGNGNGQVISYSVIDHLAGDDETICEDSYVSISNNTTTYLSLQKAISFEPVIISTESLPEAVPGEEYSYQLSATGGTEPYYWSVKLEYEEEILSESYPAITSNPLNPTNLDDGYAVQQLDFAFPYYGEEYTELTILTDGSVIFEEGFIFLRDEEALQQYKAISPYAADLMIFADQSDGIWYEGDEYSATFRWKTSMWGHPEVNVDMAVKLYPDGNIEFFYGEGITVGSEWVSGISDGAGNYSLTSISGLYDLEDNYSLRLNKPVFPNGLGISEDGLFSGVTEEASSSWDIKFQIVDNSGLIDTKVLTFATGPVAIEENGLLSAFVLEQNYPNPFNPNTRIGFNIPKNMNVELVIFNALGQKIKTLIQSQLTEGQHFVSWNGNDDQGRQVSSGVYFYKLKAENFNKSMKMLLLR